MGSSSVAKPEAESDDLPEAEQVGKGLAAAALVLYASGVIVVNTYLHQFGISDFSLVKAKFIYTGALLCLLPFAILVAVAVGRQEGVFKSLGLAMGSSALETALGVIALAVGAYLFLALHAAIPLKVALIRAAWLLLSAASVVVSILFLNNMAKAPKTGPLAKEFAIVRQGTMLLFTGILILAFGWYVRQFARDVYPLIPDAFGGNNPRTVLLLLGKDSDFVPQLGIQTEAGSKLSRPITVLYEGENTYTLLLRDGSVVQVKKDLIAGVKIVR